MEHLLSIIVPVYNVEEFLENCLDSILNQTYVNFECIVVNDGSKDGSGAICDRYAAKDKRFKVVHQENGGLSAARNTAMEIVKGDIIAFVDSDDAIEPNMFACMVELLDSNNGDIVMCDYKSTNGSTGTVRGEGVTVWTGREFTERVLKDEIGSQLWKFIYKKPLWDGVVSPHRRHAQDMWILHHVSNRAKKVVKTEEQLYIYNDTRENNISNGKKNVVKNKVDRALAFFGRMDFCFQFGYDEAIKANVINQAVGFMVNAFFNDEIFEERFEQDVETLRKYTKKYKKEIKKYCTRKDYIWRSSWISKHPKTYVTVYKLFSAKGGK